jgi:hypothetical protein
MAEVSILEHQHIAEMHESLRRKLQEATHTDAGRIDGLRNAILALVVGELYDRAREELQNYVALKKTFPGFQERAERYVSHGCDLIQAIQTKRSFPGLGSLSLAKQQEIHEKVLEHFDELKQNLKMIERVEREQRLTDVRSTVWVLRALCQTTAAVMVVYFLIDLQDGVFVTTFKVIDHWVNDLSTWLVNLIEL